MAISISATYSGTSSAGLFGVVVTSSAQKIVLVSASRAAVDADRAISSMVRSGSPFTLIGFADAGNNTRVEVWYQDGPSVGLANITTTFPGSGPGFVGQAAFVLDGAAIGTSEDWDTTSAASGSNPTLTVSASGGALVVDVGCYENSDAGFGFGSGQTSLMNFSPTRRRAASYKPGVTAGAVGMSHTNTSTDRSYMVSSWANSDTEIPPLRVDGLASIPGPGLALGISVAQIASTSSIPSPGLGVTVEASVVAAVSSVFDVGLSTSLPVSAVSVASLIPSPGISADAMAVAGEIVGTASLPAPSVALGAGISALVVEGTASVHAAAPSHSATVSTGVIQAAASVPEASISVATAIVAAAIQAVADLFSPTLIPVVLLESVRVDGAAALGGPAVAASSGVSGVSIPAVASIPGPDVAFEAAVSVLRVSATAEVLLPGVSITEIVGALSVVGVAGIPVSGLSGAASCAAALVAAVVSVQSPVLSIPQVISAARVNVVAAIYSCNIVGLTSGSPSVSLLLLANGMSLELATTIPRLEYITNPSLSLEIVAPS